MVLTYRVIPANYVDCAASRQGLNELTVLYLTRRTLFSTPRGGIHSLFLFIGAQVMVGWAKTEFAASAQVVVGWAKLDFDTRAQVVVVLAKTPVAIGAQVVMGWTKTEFAVSAQVMVGWAELKFSTRNPIC